jgi:ankyrin repeat protein
MLSSTNREIYSLIIQHYHSLFLSNACLNGDLERVKSLLKDYHVDPSLEKSKALRRASKRGHLSIVKFLLEDPRVDPCANCNEAILSAISGNHFSIVKILLEDSRVNRCFVFNSNYRVSIFHVQFWEIVKEYEKNILERCNKIKEELMIKAWHPCRVEKWILSGYHFMEEM